MSNPLSNTEVINLAFRAGFDAGFDNCMENYWAYNRYCSRLRLERQKHQDDDFPNQKDIDFEYEMPFNAWCKMMNNNREFAVKWAWTYKPYEGNGGSYKD